MVKSRPFMRVLAILASAIACITALNLVSRFLEGPDFLGDWSSELDRASNAEVGVFGSSVARYIYPAGMCLRGFNVAGAGQDIFETEALIGHLADAGNLPSTIIIGGMPGLYQLDNGADGSIRTSRRAFTYRNLRSRGDWRLIGNDWTGAVRSFAFPALGFREWSARIRMAKDRSQGRSPVNLRTIDTVIADAEADRARSEGWLSGVKRQLADLERHDGDIPERALASLRRIQRHVTESKSQLVIVLMPVSPALSLRIETSLANEIQTTHSVHARLASDRLVLVDDLIGHETSSDMNNFRNSNHLNYSGGMRYSNDLAQRLAANGVIAESNCDGAMP